jgi:hypothetical protein
MWGLMLQNMEEGRKKYRNETHVSVGSKVKPIITTLISSVDWLEVGMRISGVELWL